MTVAISLDIPPYVMGSASQGLEVEIARGALPEAKLDFVQMSYDGLQAAIGKGQADISMGVQKIDDSMAYSRDFVAFANLAIAKKADRLQIGSVADLKGHKLLTWEGASLELGDEFRRLFAPGAPYRADIVEVANQGEQVRKFWDGDGAIIIIDRAIFVQLSKAMGKSMSEVDSFALFPPVTDFKAGFRSEVLRDRFDRGLDELCRSGAYAKLLDKYDVEFPLSAVCR